MSRMFIGLPLSKEAVHGVLGVMKNLARKHWHVWWEPKEKWHVTLAFLGNNSEPSNVVQALDGIEFGERFELGLKGLGRFPELKSKTVYKERLHGRMQRFLRVQGRGEIVFPKVIYMSLKGDVQALHRLAKKVRRTLDEANIWYDSKPLKPHITLGRVVKDCPRGELAQMAGEIDKMRVLQIERKWTVNRACLFESKLSSNGSRYTILDEVKLS